MNPNDSLAEAIELLQLLGLKEYTARCYVGLTRMDTATARTLSEVTEVPRTRIYDAIRVLEAQGLVEVQHTSPKRFRAVPIDEALDRIRTQYEARFVELQEALDTIEPVDSTGDTPPKQVWSVTGREAIDSRVTRLLKDASTEIILVLGDESLLSEPLVEALSEVGDNIEFTLYAPTGALRDRIRGTGPAGATITSGLEQLLGSAATGNRAALGRILLVDHSASLLSSIDPETGDEQAVFSQGANTPVVSLICQLMDADGVLAAPESGP